MIFTHPNDDTAGGDTNGDGDESSPIHDPNSPQFGVYNGATIDLSHARISYVSSVFDWEGSTHDGTSVRITDSEINGWVNLYGLTRPVLERNRIHSEYNHTLTMSQIDDITGVALTGANTNTMVGTPAQRVISISRSSIPEGVSWTWNNDSNVSAFTGDVYVMGDLTIAPGVVVKGSMTVYGSVKAAGTAENPVIFTHPNDDTAGGDTNGYAEEVPEVNSSVGVRLETGSSPTESSFDYVIFKNMGTALSVGEFIKTSVDNSKFVNNQAAIHVDEAASFDPSLSMYYPLLPYAPPYSSLVNVSSTWFGATGLPGADVDLSGLVSKGLDLLTFAEGAVFTEIYDMSSSQLPLNIQLFENTRPWTMYTCGAEVSVGEGTEFKSIGFPVTPVWVSTDDALGVEPWRQHKQN